MNIQESLCVKNTFGENPEPGELVVVINGRGGNLNKRLYKDTYTFPESAGSPEDLAAELLDRGIRNRFSSAPLFLPVNEVKIVGHNFRLEASIAKSRKVYL